MRTLRTWGRHKERHVRANRRTHEREPHALSPLDPTTDVDTVPPIVQEQTSIGRSHGLEVGDIYYLRVKVRT